MNTRTNVGFETGRCDISVPFPQQPAGAPIVTEKEAARIAILRGKTPLGAGIISDFGGAPS